jgi:hypothetical protein
LYRTELCVLGLHTSNMAGICYVPARLVDEGVPIATSIVSSRGYLDDKLGLRRRPLLHRQWPPRAKQPCPPR